VEKVSFLHRGQPAAHLLFHLFYRFYAKHILDEKSEGTFGKVLPADGWR